MIVIVPCPDCHGEGGHTHIVGWSHRNGDIIERTTRCDVCEGSGSVEEEVQPRTLMDLEQEDFDMMEAQASRRRDHGARL